ncbi:hypothetical protein ACH4UR_09235 [Streptomyces lydicus]|uniref:hypothetical protein n=1 Tax=Streptomyces lydicus TaxID=47763 RepID=UPI0033C5BA30
MLESLVRERPAEVQAVFDRLVLTRRAHEADWLRRLARPVMVLEPRSTAATCPRQPRAGHHRLRLVRAAPPAR